ncbi:MAG: amino acid ABC transporter permease [Rhodospirillaceae bacterium]|nr:amino acid ABC transporter permease [Rhodospirillaceae bacterium]
MAKTFLPHSITISILLKESIGWARQHLFSSFGNSILTITVFSILWFFVPQLVNWSLIKATWVNNPIACQVNGGACWGLITDKYRLILFGIYPYEEQWRPFVAILLFIAIMLIVANPRFWKLWLSSLLALTLAIIATLMWGGIANLPFVSTDRWGGLPLTLILSVTGIVLSFPLAILLALGRRSKLPIIRTFCIIYIELWRGVPLISVLFMSSIMFPLLMPEGITIDKLLRAQLGIILFTAAYLAEIVRGGLQSIPRGQHEAADAIGLTYWQKMRLVILPQALRLIIPPLVGQFITTFKDTSFVIIIGLYDLLSSTRVALSDPQWQRFYIEGYLVTALIYFVFSYVMSQYSQYLERRLDINMYSK